MRTTLFVRWSCSITGALTGYTLPNSRTAWLHSKLGRGQSFNDPAISYRVAATGVDQRVQLAGERRQVGDLPRYRVPVLVGDHIDGHARLLATIGEPHQLPHLVDREAEVSRPTDEGQAPQMLALVGPVIAGRPRWCRQQADLFVIADRLDLGARRRAQLSNRQFLRHSA
jgi:hypothetical protein